MQACKEFSLCGLSLFFLAQLFLFLSSDLLSSLSQKKSLKIFLTRARADEEEVDIYSFMKYIRSIYEIKEKEIRRNTL